MLRVRGVVLGGVCVALLAGSYSGVVAPLSAAGGRAACGDRGTPSDGPSAGGTPIVIAGSGFTGATDVLIGTSDLTALSRDAELLHEVSDTEIDLTTPSGAAGTSDVQVIAGGVTSTANPPADYYTYLDQPTVTNVASPQNQAATGIAVTGSGFSIPGPPATSAVSEVDLVPTSTGRRWRSRPSAQDGGQPDCFGFTRRQEDAIDLPASAILPGQYDTEVVTPGGTSTTTSNDILVVQQAAPTVTSVSPSSGPESGGAPAVTIHGTDFKGSGFTTTTRRVIRGQPRHVRHGEQRVMPSPRRLRRGPARRTSQSRPNRPTEPRHRQAQPAPLTRMPTRQSHPSAMSFPGTGPTAGGNTVASSPGPGSVELRTWREIQRDRRHIDTTESPPRPVGVADKPLLQITNATQITVRGHARARSPALLRSPVTTPGGTSTTGPGDQYMYAVLPTVTGVSPAAGPPVGGDAVVITGSGFTGATNVVRRYQRHQQSPCPASPTAPCFTVGSATQITVQDLPAHAPAKVDITVTDARGDECDVPG